jgi:hypothetical protein
VEFDGAALDKARWNVERMAVGGGTQLASNVGLRDGNLVLSVSRVGASGGVEYVGGGVTSKEPSGFGYYEARLRVLAAKGWITTFAVRPAAGDGPEFAAVEHDSADAKKYRVRTGSQTNDVAALPLTDYHVFGCEYSAKEVKYYLDGRVVATLPVTAPGQVTIRLDAANAKGGNDSVDTGRLPGHVEVDYVRYYRRVQ